MESPEEQSEIERLRAELRDAKAALHQQSLKRLVEESYFEILCEDTGIDPFDFKKKHASDVLSAQRKKKR